MTKKLTVFFIITLLFLSGCSKSQTEQDFLDETAERASKLALNNEKFALDKFINGSWEGKCNADEAGKIVVDFQKNARIKFTHHSPDLDFGSGFEQGLYEIADEKTIKLHYLATGEFIEIEKITNDKIKFSEGGRSVIYGCNFDRIRK